MPLNDAIVVICARTESKRIPGKVFKQLAGIPVIDHILTRLSKSGLQVILAVPTNELSLFRFYLGNRFPFVTAYGGNADSPLHRMTNAIKALCPEIKYVVRITCDDPLIDVQTMHELLDDCRKNESDYGISPAIIEGAGVEVFSRGNLFKAAENRVDSTEFISYFTKNVDKISRIFPRQGVVRNYRCTLDWPEDAILLEIVFRTLGRDATLDQIAEFLDENPTLQTINQMPSVSFYTCVRNGSKYIGKTIDCLIDEILKSQSEKKYEYFIIDDMSTDDTALILGEKMCRYGAYGTFRKINLIFNNSNYGLAASSNIAIDNCRGKWVMRIDADDLLYNLDPLIRFAEEGNYDLVYPSYFLIGEHGQLLVPEIQNPKPNHHAGCALMRRSFINELRFRDGIVIGDSAEFYNRAQKVGKIGYYEDGPIWGYRKHSESLTASAK